MKYSVHMSTGDVISVECDDLNVHESGCIMFYKYQPDWTMNNLLMCLASGTWKSFKAVK